MHASARAGYHKLATVQWSIFHRSRTHGATRTGARVITSDDQNDAHLNRPLTHTHPYRCHLLAMYAGHSIVLIFYYTAHTYVNLLLYRIYATSSWKRWYRVLLWKYKRGISERCPPVVNELLRSRCGRLWDGVIRFLYVCEEKNYLICLRA